MDRRACILWMGLAAAAAWGPAASAAPAAAERQRIERLIAAIEAREDLRFVRNGSAYKARDAARFLREKFKSRGDDVRTADDFIEKIASRSSTSGRNYLIRHADGREEPSRDFLQRELQRLPSP